MRIKIVLFIIALMISLQATTAYGMVGIGVSPGNMSFKLAPGMSAEQTVYVINTGNETAKYDLFVNESAYRDWFTFSPSSFDLKAGGQKAVKVTLKVPASAETDVKCKINIPCTEPGRVVGAGVIIPVRVELSILEESYSEGISSGGSYPEGRENSSGPVTKIETKEGLRQYIEKNMDEELNKSLGDVIKNLSENNSSGLVKIENYEEKFHTLPGFNVLPTYVCLVISGLLIRRRLF